MEATAQETVLFAGGGTGGHLSPGLAIAEVMSEAMPTVGRMFACSTRSIDHTMLQAAGEVFTPMPAQPFGTGPRSALRFLAGWQRARRVARRLLRDEQVRVVVALGGYAAAPTVSAAARLGIPVVLLNLDAVPGKANRLMIDRCNHVLSTCATPDHPSFAGHRIPMPLRRATLAPGAPVGCRRALGLEPEAPVLLITGASQGSTSLNELMAQLARSCPEALEGWQIHHLTGSDRPNELEKIYSTAGLMARVEPFLHEMGLAWGAADLVISRAGANSVAEIASNTVPAVFLPYPHHRDRHQYANAQPLVDVGGAVVLDDLIDPARNVATHSGVLTALLADRPRRNRMRDALVAHRPENGASAVIDVIRPLLRSTTTVASP